MRSRCSSDEEIRSGSGTSSSMIECVRGVGNFREGVRDGSTSYPRNHRIQRTTLLSTIKAAYFSIGVIFGDIGTSPIYAYRVILSILDHSNSTLFGTVSLIIWSFLSIVVVKYLIIMVSADDNGEGGCFAVYSIICRHLRLNASGEDPTFHDELDRQLTTYSNYESKREKLEGDSFLRRSKIAQSLLLLLTLLSASLILGDGVLTPAVSVLSSMEGLAVEVPSMGKLVLPLTCALMFAVFVIQGFGTHRLSSTFSPLVMLWLLANAGIGFYNIIQHNPSIMKAFSPHYAIMMIYERPYKSWLSLQGVLLCITGAEALFADMGHFTKHSIRLATTTVVLPCLTITYLGQAAYILKFPNSVLNPFWLSIPRPLYWPVFVLSIMVTVIASQALISASFSIIHQAVAINCFPPIRINHTSKKVYGQIYASSFNYILMLLSIFTVLIFKTSIQLTSAYGVAVSIVMTLSTISAALVMYKVWELHWSIVALFLVVYAFIDGAYLTSNLLKTTYWGWYTIVISAVGVALMILWRWGKLLTLEGSKKKSRTARHMYKGLLEKRFNLNDDKHDYTVHNWNTFNNLGEIRKCATTMDISYSKKKRDDDPLKRRMSQKVDNEPDDCSGLVKIPGACVFYTNQHGVVPPVFYQYLEIFPAIFSITVFLHIRRAIVPYVGPGERLRVMELRYEGFYSVVATFGYMDIIEPGEKLAEEIFAGLKHLEITNYRDEVEYNDLMKNIGNKHINSQDLVENVTNSVRITEPIYQKPTTQVYSEFSNIINTLKEPKLTPLNELQFGEPTDLLSQNTNNELITTQEGNSKNFIEKRNKPQFKASSNIMRSTTKKRDLITHLNMRINHMMHAYSTGVTYIISENYLFADKARKWFIFSGLRKYLIESVFNFLRLITVSAATLHEIPLNRSVVISTKLEG